MGNAPEVPEWSAIKPAGIGMLTSQKINSRYV